MNGRDRTRLERHTEMEYFNYFTLLHAVVIINLVVLAYITYTFRKMQDALGILFVAIEQMSKGNPVRVTIDGDDQINITFPRMDQDNED